MASYRVPENRSEARFLGRGGAEAHASAALQERREKATDRDDEDQEVVERPLFLTTDFSRCSAVW